MHELEKRADQHRLQALRKISALSQDAVSDQDSSEEDKQSLGARVAKKIDSLRTRFSS
jgi:hypothetical protein